MRQAQLIADQLLFSGEDILKNFKIGCTPEQMFQSIFSLISEGVFIQNDENEIAAISPAAEKMLGLAASELTGQSFDAITRAGKLIHEDGSDFSWDSFPAVITSRTAKPINDVVLGIHKPDGILVWLSINSQPLISQGASAPCAVATILRDITGSKLAASALSNSEQHQRLLEQQKVIQTSLDGFWIVRATDARFLEVNEAYCSMVGYSRDELLAMRISDLEANESPAEIAAHIKKTIAIGHDRFETRHHHKQGRMIELEVSSSYSKTNGGEFFVFVRDISERKHMERAVVAREQEFRSLAESSPNFIVRYDRDGRHLYLNDRLLKLLELASAAEVIGRRPDEVWTDGRFAALEQAALRAVEIESQIEIEIVQPTESGASRYHQLFIVPEQSATGQVVGTIAFGWEITAIRETERKLMNFIENLPGVAYTFRLSPDGHASLPYTSTGITELYGLRPEDVKNDFTPLHMLAHPDDRPRIKAAVAESARTMTPIRLESRICRPGLPDRWQEIRSMPEREADGSIIWHGIMLDITERKQAEALLVHREREFRTLTESLPDNIVRYNRQGVTVYVNPVLERTLGDLATAMIGTTPREYHPDGAFEDYALLLDEVLASGEAGELEKIFSGPDGKTEIHRIRMVPERGENGEVLGVISIGHDITERKQTENQLRELTAHLQTVREEEKIRLAREIHDDLGSTLAALNLKVSLLLDFEVPDGMKKTPLFARLESLPPLIDNAIAATRRIISGMRPDVLDNLGLKAALEWQAEQFNRLSGIECYVVCTRDPNCKECIKCDYELGEALSIHLFRIFQEALTNVARHSGASRVEVEFFPGKENIILSISDNGYGLPEEKTTSPASYGMRGMRERVGQLNGQIDFENIPGGGLRVTARVPQSVENRISCEVN